MSVAEAYSRSARGWATGAGLVYVPLADALVGLAGDDLTGRLALDAGAGTGAATMALAGRGAEVVATDLAHGMLVEARRTCGRLAVADVLALPFADGAFDVVVAAFVVNHLEDPVAALRELARATAPDGRLLVSSFSVAGEHAGRARVDQSLRDAGWSPPAWYRRVKETSAPMLGDRASVEALADRAGLREVTVLEEPVDAGIDTAAKLVEYRFGQAHVVDFLAGLDADAEAELRAGAAAAAGDDMEPFVPSVVMLAASPGEDVTRT